MLSHYLREYTTNSYREVLLCNYTPSSAVPKLRTQAAYFLKKASLSDS